jgi:hypothetical protein
MKQQQATLLAAGLLAFIASSQQTQLGNVTFGAPICGGLFADGTVIKVSDCTAAVNQLLDENCISGSCSIPPLPGAGKSEITQSVGTCTAIVAAEGANGATFDEAPVQDAFPGFIAECVKPGSGEGERFPSLTSTNGLLELVFATSGPTGGG